MPSSANDTSKVAASASAATSSSSFAKKKYKGKGGRCKFLATREGCRRGDACQFSHGGETAAAAAGATGNCAAAADGRSPAAAARAREPGKQKKKRTKNGGGAANGGSGGAAAAAAAAEGRQAESPAMLPKKLNKQPNAKASSRRRKLPQSANTASPSQSPSPTATDRGGGHGAYGNNNSASGNRNRVRGTSSNPSNDEVGSSTLSSEQQHQPPLPSLRALHRHLDDLSRLSQKQQNGTDQYSNSNNGSNNKRRNGPAPQSVPVDDERRGLIDEARTAARRLWDEAAALREERDGLARELERFEKNQRGDTREEKENNENGAERWRSAGEEPKTRRTNNAVVAGEEGEEERRRGGGGGGGLHQEEGMEDEPRLAAAAAAATYAPPPPLLTFLRSSVHPELLTVSHEAYATYLRDLDDDLDEVSDLIEAVREDEYLATFLADGGIRDGFTGEFRDAILEGAAAAAAAAAGDSAQISPPVGSVSAVVANDNVGATGVGGWQCQACTFINTDPAYLVCATCCAPRSAETGVVENAQAPPPPEAVSSSQGGKAGSSNAQTAAALEELRKRQEAVRKREEDEEAERRAEEEARKRAEEAARRKVAKEKAAAEAKARAKLKEQRKKEEAERAATEEAEMRAAEERLRQDVLAEKRAALERHEALKRDEEEKEKKKKSVQAKGKPSVAGKVSSSPGSSKGIDNEAVAPTSEVLFRLTRSTDREKQADPRALKKHNGKDAAPARSKNKVTSDFPIILYGGTNTSGTISPIFKMLRDPSTLPRARSILALEAEIVKRKSGEDGVRDQIAACRKQIGKIEDAFARLMSEKKTPKELQEEASKQQKKKLEALKKRFEKELKTREDNLRAELWKKRPEMAEAEARSKRERVHGNYLAPLEAIEKDLDAKKLKIKKDKDEQLGVFKLQAGERNRRETVAAAEKKRKDTLAKIKKDQVNALEKVDKERKEGIAKIDKKKKASLGKIKQSKDDKLGVLVNNKVQALGEIEDWRKKEFEAANISTAILDTLGSRFFESKETRKKRDEIETQAKERREAVEKKEKEEKHVIEKKSKERSDPIIRQAEEDQKEVVKTAEKEREAVEKMIEQRQETAEKQASDRKEAAEKEARETRAAVEKHVSEMKDVIEQNYNKKMGDHEAESAEKLKEVQIKREAIQPKVREEMDSIQEEFDRDMAEVTAYQTSVTEAFKWKEADYEEKYRRDAEDIDVSTQEFIQKTQMSDTKREADRDEGVALQRDKIGQLGKDLIAKHNELDETRAKIAEVKGKGQREDPSFDIDMLDHFGNTFLMICAQRSDITTAKVCIELGASPYETNDDNLTAMSFATYFKDEEMIALLAENGASGSRQPFDELMNRRAWAFGQHAIDWETQLRISEQAAIPPDTFLASAEDLDEDEDSRMPTLSIEERERDYSCFEARLLSPETTRNFRRVVFIEKSVYTWLVDADRSVEERSQFFSLLRSLMPANSENIACHRRAIVGVRPQFEVLCAALEPDRITAKSTVVHFTPFVSGEVHGVADIGVLLWAISSEKMASYVKALIEQSEFKRNKVEDDKERFLPHTDFIMPLGKDMHLLDLKSTSTWKSSPMTLFAVGVDSGELSRMEANDVNWTPKTRTLESERILRKQLFRRSQSELRENEEILHDSRTDLSTNLFGGAGTGKTMLLIQKVASECAPHRRLLVVTRLPRLVAFIKSGVKAQKGISVNVDYFTYDELLTFLARRCQPSNTADKHTFSVFSEIHFSETTGTGLAAGVSFQNAFIDGYLTTRERLAMKQSNIEPLTLWTALRVIKSHTNVARTKKPLDRQEYLSLPKIFGFDAAQREVAYDLYEKYRDWMLGSERFLWDEADRVLYCLKFGESVFAGDEFVSWEERTFKWGEDGMVDDHGMPQPPFYHLVFADEAQDFSDLDIALFIRMSSGVRSVFLGADPAQSVELGIRMRDGGINDVFHSSLARGKNDVHVKDVLQDIRLKTNHRTHQQNLDLSLAIRRVLTRSFCVPGADENSIAKGPVPEALLLKQLADLRSETTFKGANVVFIVPDETLSELRALFLNLGIKNDLFGVREAKGLEFDQCAILGFFSYFESRGSAREWQNCLRWLFSKTGIKVTSSSESVSSHRLEPCDYLLLHPEIEDQAMMLYTALTRARQHLYIIEDIETGKKERRGKVTGLGDFAFRHLQQLHLIKTVRAIDAGETEMTPQEHNARGVLLVTKAIALSNNGTDINEVVEKFEEAADRFRPDKGCDSSLLHQCLKHKDAIVEKRELIQELKRNFFSESSGKYLLAGRFAQVLAFETKAAKFVHGYIDDPFTVDEVRQLGAMMEDAFFESAYWIHFEEICDKIKECCCT